MFEVNRWPQLSLVYLPDFGGGPITLSSRLSDPTASLRSLCGGGGGVIWKVDIIGGFAWKGDEVIDGFTENCDVIGEFIWNAEVIGGPEGSCIRVGGGATAGSPKIILIPITVSVWMKLAGYSDN